MRRWISLAVAITMILPVAASVAEGTMATWLSPQPGQIVSGGKVEVAVGYNTGTDLKVTSVDLYVDGQYYARKILRNPETRGVLSFWWDTTRVEQGTHNLVVKVYSGDSVISKVYGTGTVGPNAIGGGTLDVRPPVVTFANIKAGDVIKGTKTIKMNAVDDSGRDPMVSLMVDDSLKLLKNTPPYTYNLDSTTYANGGHSLKTFAYDAAGNRSDPAVIKVEFRNGGDLTPVVTTLTVNPEPKSEPAKISKATPPSMAADIAPSIKGSASRDVTHLADSSSAAPVVAPEPKPIKLVASAPKAESKIASVHSAAVLSTSPVRMASASTSTSLRKGDLKPAMAASASAASPIVIPAPNASGIHSASAARIPAARATLMCAPALAKGLQTAVPKVTAAPKPVMIASARIAEPKHIALPAASKHSALAHVSVAPKSSGPVKMAMASQLPTTHQIKASAVSSAAVSAFPRVMDQPVCSSVKNVRIDHRTAVKIARIASVSPSAAMAAAPKVTTPPASPKISKSVLKQVRVAMAPDFRTASQGVRGGSAITRPEIPAKPVRARIEKTTAPASGKVKARSFFHDMGGVLFWDPSTHTVTACVGKMVIEMQIGSKAAKVNGHEFAMDTAPYILNGRTIIEAQTYRQACNLLESLQHVSKAETH